MKRVGLLIHPFYAKEIVGYTKSIYENSIKEYDMNIILSPAMRDIKQIESFLLEYDKEINNYLYQDVDSLITLTIGDINYSVNTSSIIDKRFTLAYVESLKEALGDKYSYDDFVGVYKAMMSNDLTLVREYSIFKGDIIPTYNKDIMDIIYNTLWINESVVGLYHVGPIYFALTKIKKILETHILEVDREDTIIDIYGEYLNQCVLDMARVIRRYGYRVNIIANKSIAYTGDNTIYDGAYGSIITEVEKYFNGVREEFHVVDIFNNKKQFLIIDKELV